MTTARKGGEIISFDYEVDVDYRQRVQWRNDTALYDHYYSLVESIPEKTHGIYFLLNKSKELLYIGITINLRRRIVDHLAKGPSSNTRHFADEIAFVRYRRVENPDELDALETLAIKEMNPRYNVEKTPKSSRYQSLIRKDGS